MQITLFRTVVLYIVVIAVMRVLGKRQVGELEPSELVVTILVSELAAVPMQNSGLPLVAGIVPIAVLLALGLMTSALTVESPNLRRLFCGKPSIIIENGCFVQREIRRLRLSVDEVTEELRLKGVTDMKQVKYGIVETNGQMSVIKYSESTESLPVAIICNGKLMRENMRLLKMSERDVMMKLEKKNISRVRDVFYMCCDENGKINIVKNED